MLYQYHTSGGKAVLNKGDDYPLKKLGQFKSEKEAKHACEKHYLKVKKMAENFGNSVPACVFS